MANRRAAVALLLLSATLSLGQTTQSSRLARDLPIIFVHGNGDDAARWVPTIWLFESNGYPAGRLFAVRFRNPSARTSDNQDQAFRSSTADARAELSAFVDRVLKDTGSPQVVLVGSSRGGLTIRNYLKNGGGRDKVAKAILCGTPNHGVTASPDNLEGEFNGSGHFLTALNQPGEDGSESAPGVAMMTLRSDHFDKFAQPTLIAAGHSELATGITFEGPSLKGADNKMLPGLDHRELAFSREAFAYMFPFITGRQPHTLQVVAQPHPILSGVITGFAEMVATNQPVAGVHLRIFQASSTGALGESPVFETTTSGDGHWGPFTAKPNTEYDFDLESSPTVAEPTGTGRGATAVAPARHVRLFFAVIPRSTQLLNLRLLPVPGEATALLGQPAFVVLRPEGYFSRQRDPVLLDGELATEEPDGLPVRDSFLAQSPGPAHPTQVTLRKEILWLAGSRDLRLDLPVACFLW